MCLHILVIFASGVPTLLDHNKTTSSTKDPESIAEIIPRSPQKLYVTNSLVSELLTGLPGDRVFAVDALLCSPGIIVKDHVVCQWLDDFGKWHTYGYNDCRMLEDAFLVSAGPCNKRFTVNLISRHDIREESGTAKPVKRLLTSQLGQAASDAVDGEAGDKEETRRKLAAELTRILFPVLIEI